MLRPLGLFVLVLALFVSPVAAQDEPEVEDAAVSVIAWWVPGEVRRVEVEKGTRTFVNDSLREGERSRTVYEVSIIEETESNYLVRWTAIEYEGDEDDDIEISEDLLERLNEEGVLVRTTELGEMQGIENLGTLQELVADVLSQLEYQYKEQDVDEAVLAQMRESFSSEGFIQEILFPEIAFFYALHGYELPLNREWEYTELLPHYFGGNPMLARGKSRVAHLDKDEGFFVLENSLTVDDHEVSQMVLGMTGTDAAEFREKFDASMLMTDKNIYRIDYFTGWTLGVDRLRTVEIDISDGEMREHTVTEHYLKMALLD